MCDYDKGEISHQSAMIAAEDNHTNKLNILLTNRRIAFAIEARHFSYWGYLNAQYSFL